MKILIGLGLSLGGILIGNLIEGGSIASLAQGTAAMIVFAGTFGATFISNRWEDVVQAFKMVLGGREISRQSLADQIVQSAQVARVESILALEKKLGSFSDPFMQSVYRMVIDGIDPNVIRRVFEEEIDVSESRKMAAAKVWSDAGGFAPTVGIIGAVLGLIHVMGHISDTSELGKGIAVAFVATIYGVGSANLVFLPIANRIKAQIRYRSETERMILEGGLGVVSGLKPYIIEQKVEAFTA